MWTSLTSVFVLASAVRTRQARWILWAIFHLCFGVNYWRDARYGMRRNLDMGNIVVGASRGLFILLRDGEPQDIAWILTLQTIGLAMYGASWRYAAQNNKAWIYWHAVGMHGFCNAANMLFFHKVIKG